MNTLSHTCDKGLFFLLFFLSNGCLTKKYTLLSDCYYPSVVYQNTVDKLIKKTNLALLVGTNSWRDQFIEAITVSAGKSSGEGYVCVWLCTECVCFYQFNNSDIQL